MTPPAPKMTVQTVRIDSLTPDPENARKHSTRNLDAIAASLEDFGQRRPIVVTAGGVVIAGNGTMEAAKQLGWELIAVTRTPADWSYEQARAYALADNRTAELADWDAEVLAEQLLELDAAGWSVGRLGFDVGGRDDEDVVQDDVPDVPKVAKSKLGELWALGEHFLLVGDSTDLGSVQLLMGGGLADCVFTDPPYNVDYVGKTKDAMVIENDAMGDAEFRVFLGRAYACMFEVTAPGAAVYVCHADTAGVAFRSGMVDAGFLLKQVLVWVKNAFVLGRQDYHWQHEPILYGWKPGAPHRWYADRRRATLLDEETDIALMQPADLVLLLEELRAGGSVIREDRPHRSADHLTMKPVPLVARLVCNSTRMGDVVLDPFGGSGSTLIACEQMGRRCRTIEMDPRYADVIIERWEALTGLKAERVSRGAG